MSKPFMEQGAEPPRYTLFKTLRDLWIKAAPEGETRTVSGLAKVLGVRRTRCSSWATGSDPTHIPPWWVLMWLCDQLGMVIALGPSEANIYPDPKRGES